MNEELKLEDAEIAPAPWHITPVAFSDPIITDANHRPVHFTRDILERIVEAVNRVDELGKAILGKLPMSEQFDTFPHLLALMRSDPLYNPHNDPSLVEANKTLRHSADRLEAAAKREISQAAEDAASKATLDRTAKDAAEYLAYTMAHNSAPQSGNVAKMREALKLASYFLHQHHMGAVYAPDGETVIFCEDVAKAVDAALAAPARNSDIGTAAEQVARFTEVCKSHSRDGARGLCNTDCPFHENEYGSDCALAWGQMPYKEAVRNEQTALEHNL